MALIGQAVPAKMFKIMVMFMCLAPGQGQTTTWCQMFFININLKSV